METTKLDIYIIVELLTIAFVISSGLIVGLIFMNPLVLAVLVGGGYVLLKNKKKSTGSSGGSSPKIDYSKLSEKGYYFVDCKNVIIKDETKAFKYVYKVAKTTNAMVWDGLVFDGCVSNVVKQYQSDFINGKLVDTKKLTSFIKDAKQAKFLFEIIRYMSLALVEKGESEDIALKSLEMFKKQATDAGIDTSKWDTSLPEPPEQIEIENGEGEKFPIINDVSDADWNTKILNGAGLVLVDFWAEWCGFCKDLEPLLQKLMSENEKIKVYRINYDENKTASSFYEIKVLPTLLLFSDGVLIGRKEGVLSYSSLLKFVDSKPMAEGFEYGCDTLKTLDPQKRDQSLGLIIDSVSKELNIGQSNYLGTDPILFGKLMISKINPGCIKNPGQMTVDEKAIYLLLVMAGIQNIPASINVKFDNVGDQQAWDNYIASVLNVMNTYLQIKDEDKPVVEEIQQVIKDTGNYP